jgi:hypothetical protein
MVENGDLVDKGLDDFRVAMTLIHRRISRKEVEVFFAVDIPQKHSLTFVQNRGQGRVVMANDSLFALNDFARFWR